MMSTVLAVCVHSFFLDMMRQQQTPGLCVEAASETGGSGMVAAVCTRRACSLPCVAAGASRVPVACVALATLVGVVACPVAALMHFRAPCACCRQLVTLCHVAATWCVAK